MASRATPAQLLQLGLDSNALAQIPVAARQAALDAASARIDSALGTQFELPLSEPYPMDLIECECVLASWTLLLTKGYNPQGGEGSDNLEKRYNEWRDYLDKVSRGLLVPNVIDAEAADEGVTGPTVITSTQRGYSERGVDTCSLPHSRVGRFSND